MGEPKPPKKVDTAWVKNFGFDTAHPSAIPSMLRWLGVIDEEDQSTGVWDKLRVASTRQETLAQLVRSAYQPIFDAIDVEHASTSDLRGAFVSAYSVGDPRRHIGCFLALCNHAGIATAEEATSRESSTGGETKPKAVTPKKSQASKATSPKTPRQPRQIAPEGGGITITLNVEIPADWTEEQIRERYAAVARAVELAGE